MHAPENQYIVAQVPPVTLTQEVEKQFEKDSKRVTGDGRGNKAEGAFPNLSRARIAEHTGLSKSGVARMFRGDRWPSHKAAEKIAAALGIKIGELLQELGDARDRCNSGSGVN
jgi:ribosome-binding protein aMBF1 (putative translation factor)